MADMSNPEDRMIKMQQIVNAMGSLAGQLHDIMQPGMSLVISFQKEESIIVPNKEPEFNHMIITRPALIMNIEAKKHEKRA